MKCFKANDFASAALAGVLFVVALTIAACTTAQTDRFVERVTNFNRGVAAVDEAIAKTSAALYKHCKSIQAVAQAADDITGTCTKASPVVSAGNTAIKSLCQADQITDIASTVVAAANTVSAVKSQLAAAKASCTKGG